MTSAALRSSLGSTIANSSCIAISDARTITAQVGSAAVVYVPSLATDVHDVEGLKRVGRSLLSSDPS